MNDASNSDGSDTGQADQTTQPHPEEQEVRKEEENKEPAEQKKPGFQFPSTFAILFGLTILVAILTWIIPAGVYNLNAAGEPVPGTYHEVASKPARILVDSLTAPITSTKRATPIEP